MVSSHTTPLSEKRTVKKKNYPVVHQATLNLQYTCNTDHPVARDLTLCQTTKFKSGSNSKHLQTTK